MKTLKSLIAFIALTICISSCVSSYRHNNIRVPNLDSNTVADISSDITPLHVNASACVKVDKRYHVMASAYYSIPAISRSKGHYHEIGVGSHKVTAKKNYRGTYATIGYGTCKGAAYNGLWLLGARDSDVDCAHARLSVTFYAKSTRRKTMRYYIAMRSSLVYYTRYREHYKWDEFDFLGGSAKTGFYKSDDIGQIVLDPVLGMERKLGKHWYLYAQGNLTWSPFVDTVELDGHTFRMPQNTLFSMRMGLGYVWQKSVKNTIKVP